MIDLQAKAIAMGFPADIRWECRPQWQRLYVVQDGMCFYCDCGLLKESHGGPQSHAVGGQRPFTRDHVMPVAWRGRTQENNKVLACEPCNQAKGDSYPTLEMAKRLVRQCKRLGLEPPSWCHRLLIEAAA